MKIDNILLESMPSDENSMEAYKLVKRNKGAPGVDGMSINELKGYLDENIDIIRAQIELGNINFVKRVEIPKDAGGVRNLGIPTIMDRVI